MKAKWLLAIFATIGLGLIAGDLPSAFAQEEEFTLEEITVTAQKRAENSQKVAIQMDVLSGADLTEKGVTTLQQALAGVADAFVQDAAKDFIVVIRGMTNNNMPGDSVNQVALSVDGSYSNNFMTGQSGFYDMQRVEVLSGPQGTLYSRNTSGGIVNLISNDPSTESIEGSATLGIGNYSQINAQAMVNTPITDQLAFRAAFNVTAHDGYLSNGTADDDTKSMRLKLGYKPSDTFSSVLTYEYTKIGGVSKYGFVVPFEDEDDVDDPWTSTIPGRVYRADRASHRYILNMNVSTPIGEVTFLPSISRYQEHNRQQDPLKVRPDGSPSLGGGPSGSGTTVDWRSQIRSHRQEETSIELRIASPDDFFMKYLLGLYYYKMKWDNNYTKDATYFEDNFWPYVLSWSVQENPSKSAFGNITYPVTDAFRITAGGRYTSDKETRHGYDSTGGRSGQDFYNESGPFENSHFDYKVGAEYDLNPSTMLWVDYSTGYKMGFQGRPAQELKAYQAGEKGRFFNNTMQLNLSAFYYDYRNFQINVGSIEVDGLEYMGSGLAKAEIYGLDLSTKYLITQQDDISISVAYLNSSIKDATIIYSNMMTQEELPPVVLSSNLPKLNGSPKLTITGSYNHIFDLTGGGNITASVNPRYVSEKTLMFQPSAVAGYDVDKLNTEPNHLMLDASLTFYNADGKWNVNAYGKNLTNHAEKTGFYMGLDFMQISAPRTYGATISVKF